MKGTNEMNTMNPYKGNLRQLNRAARRQRRQNTREAAKRADLKSLSISLDRAAVEFKQVATATSRLGNSMGFFDNQIKTVNKQMGIPKEILTKPEPKQTVPRALDLSTGPAQAAHFRKKERAGCKWYYGDWQVKSAKSEGLLLRCSFVNGNANASLLLNINQLVYVEPKKND
jgi:hypothetical protein